jgi:hypothetical protein
MCQQSGPGVAREMVGPHVVDGRRLLVGQAAVGLACRAHRPAEDDHPPGDRVIDHLVPDAAWGQPRHRRPCSTWASPADAQAWIRRRAGRTLDHPP